VALAKTMGRNKGGTPKRYNKSTGTSRHRQEKGEVDDEDQHASVDQSIMCQPVTSSSENPLKGLQLRMWDFAQCDPKRCTGARLERRGVFRGMPLKQPFKGIVLSPNGTVSVSPADKSILQDMVR
jgi:pre-rRNA-processing protein TSR3